MNITSADILIFKHLFEQVSPTPIYYFHEKFNLSPVHMSSFINKYDSFNIFIYNENGIELTVSGRLWIIKNRHQIFLSSRKKKWRYTPEEWKMTE